MRPQVGLSARSTDIIVRPVPGDPLTEMKGLGATAVKDGSWSLPLASWNLASILDLLPDAEVATAVLEALQPIVEDVSGHPRAKDLLAYQRIGAGRLLGATGQLLCMSPGLGKTPTSIVAADLAVRQDTEGGVLVVAPASLMRTWEREVKTWSEYPHVSIAHGKDEPVTPEHGWTITSYDTLARHPEWFRRTRTCPWSVVIVDESILVKSKDAKRTKAVDNVLTKRRWLLSGQPVSRYPDDLWSQLRLCDRRAFPSYWRFAERYCYVEANAWGPGKIVVGAKRTTDAARDNSDLMYVLHQKDALALPEYLFEVVDVDLKPRQRKAYEQMLTEFIAELDGNEMTAENKVARLVRLQQITSGLAYLGVKDSAKHDAIIDLIDAGAYEPPYLFWTHWRENGALLADRLRAAGITTELVQGGMANVAQDEAIGRYKAGVSQALVLSLGVGKFGHTLTSTKTVFYVDKTWNADDYGQSLRRVRRFGLEHSPVVVTLRAPGTVDELVERNLEGKLGAIARITNGELIELLRGLGKG